MQNYSYPSSSEVTITGIGDPTGQPVPNDAVYIAAENPSGNLEGLKTDSSGNLLVSLENTQIDQNVNLDEVGGAAITLGTKTASASLPVILASDQPALPLSTGAATSALQTTGNTSLSSIDSKTPALGQAVMASSSPVVIASDQSAIPVSASALPLPSGAATEATLSTLNGKFGSLGQKAMAGSAPVTIASDQSAIPASQSGTWNINNISGTVSLPTGAATDSTLSTMSGKLPATLGQKTSSNSMAVVIASDQSAVTVSEVTSGTSTITSVSGAVTSTQLLASNTSRKNAAFYNDSTAILYLKLGTTASTTSYTVQIPASGYYELPVGKIYTGEIDGIWSGAVGAVRITELT